MTTAAARPSATDVREGGAWTRTQHLKNTLLVVLVRVTLAALAPFPESVLRALGRAIGLLALVVLPRARRIAWANLRTAFPERTTRERRALLRRVYLTLGGYLGDAAASIAGRRANAPLPIDDSSLALLTGSSRGVVFASAHLGPWELVAETLAARGVPLTVLAREAYDPRLAYVYERLRPASGVGTIYRGADGAATRIVRTLRRGGVLGIPMDLRSRVPSIDVPFLGHRAPTAIGPARIALRTRSDVVVGTVAPDPHGRDGALRITCTAIPTEDLGTKASEGAEDAETELDRERILTARINAELSARILALPTAWVWMHDRFGAGFP